MFLMLVNPGGRTRYRVFKNIFVILEIKADKSVCGGGGGDPGQRSLHFYSTNKY